MCIPWYGFPGLAHPLKENGYMRLWLVEYGNNIANKLINTSSTLAYVWLSTIH